MRILSIFFSSLFLMHGFVFTDGLKTNNFVIENTSIFLDYNESLSSHTNSNNGHPGNLKIIGQNNNVAVIGRWPYGQCCAVNADADYVYFGSGTVLSILDITNPSAHLKIGEVYLPDLILDIFIQGDFAYVADEEAGLQIINISDPENPVEAGFYETPGRATGVWVSGDYIYIADNECGLCIAQFEPEETSHIRKKNEPVINGFSLNQNYPNPFNPVTTIEYSVSEKSDVTITVYDLSGQIVTVLVNQTMEPGHYSVQFDASDVASAVYIYQIQAGGFSDTRKCLIVK